MIRHRGDRSRGFTLLEVLATAMIFAMVVTVLIGSSSEAVYRAGLSATRLEASQIADRELAVLESLLNSQLPPPPDKEESRDDYLVRVTSVPALEDIGDSGFAAGVTTPSNAPGFASDGLSAIGSMLVAQAPGVEQFLLRYEIEVEWMEGTAPDRIQRTTYAFDWGAARLALPDLFAAGTAEPDGDASSDDAAELLEQLKGAGGRAS